MSGQRILRVDMDAGTVQAEPFDQRQYGFFGGRGLIARFLLDECPPRVDPLSPKSPLLFATTLFAGTILPTAGRLSIGAKSPLTGTVKKSNAGGTLAVQLAAHGLKLIAVTGAPKDGGWRILHIDGDGRSALESADEYAGLDNYALCDALRARFGDGIAVAGIGRAGEQRSLAASIQVTEFQTGHPCRAAARGGIGAVMGAKGLKAVVVERAKTPWKPAFSKEDAEAFRAYNKQVVAAILKNPLTGKTMPRSGSAAGIDVTGKMGALPVDNFSGRRSDKWAPLNSENWTALLAARGGKGGGMPCQPGCIVRCSNDGRDADGNFVSAGLEYETLALMGPNLGIYDPDAVLRLDRLCDDMGLDTIEIGGALGVAMDCGVLPFGDAAGAVDLLTRALDPDAPLPELRNGCQAVGEALGAKRIPTAKRQSMAAYDPRVIKGYGMTFERSPMGADHTSGAAMTYRKDLSPEQQTDTALSHICTCDNFMCLFPWSAVDYDPAAREAISRMAGLIAGKPDTDARLIDALGGETLALERAFNAREGFTKADDRLSDFFYEEPAEATGAPYESPFEK